MRDLTAEHAERMAEARAQRDRLAFSVPKLIELIATGVDPEIGYNRLDAPAMERVPYKPMKSRSLWVLQATVIDKLFWGCEAVRAEGHSKVTLDRLSKRAEYQEAWGLLRGFVTYGVGGADVATKWSRIRIPNGEETNLGEWFHDLCSTAAKLKGPHVLMCRSCGSYFWGKQALRADCPLCESTSLCDLEDRDVDRDFPISTTGL